MEVLLLISSNLGFVNLNKYFGQEIEEKNLQFGYMTRIS